MYTKLTLFRARASALRTPSVARNAWTALPILLAALLAGCASTPAATGARSALKTPAPTAPPLLLYQSNFTSGASAASAWTLADGWTLTAGGLANGGHSTTTVVVPYTPTATNYTITMVVKVNAVVGSSPCGDAFGLEGQTPAGAPVWDAMVVCIDSAYHGNSEMYCSNIDGGMGTWDYSTGVSPRTYVINVSGQYVSYSPSGQDLGTAHCALPTSPLKLVLINTGMDTIIQSISITTP